MKNKPIFILAGVGVLLGVTAAVYFGRKKPAEPPVFTPAANPYAQGIYANGIIESHQSNGENINIYPEVGGTVVEILVHEAQAVQQGDPLLRIDDSIQKATAEQQKSQAEAALAALRELKAQPRKEVLEVSQAQAEAARANLKTVTDQHQKLQRSYQLNPRSVSRNDLDNAVNAVKVAEKNLQVALKQYDLTRAGAWIYDVQNQEKQYNALLKQSAASNALLAKYTIRAPTDGVVLAIKTAVGSYVSPQGSYGTYTQGFNPMIVMGGGSDSLQVRTYVDEILVHRLPEASQLHGKMFIRGTNYSAPLEFVRIQPYVTPKIELSDQRQERVDVRVLPIVFKFQRPKDFALYPGQLVDVYLGEKAPQQLGGAAGGGAVKK